MQQFPTFVFFLYQVTDDLIVKVVHFLPLDPFPLVLILLAPQCQFNEYLLQLFIAVVDTELLKSRNH